MSPDYETLQQIERVLRPVTRVMAYRVLTILKEVAKMEKTQVTQDALDGAKFEEGNVAQQYQLAFRRERARRRELERVLQMLGMVLLDMRASGSWDSVTLDRVIENLAPYVAFTKPKN